MATVVLHSHRTSFRTFLLQMDKSEDCTGVNTDVTLTAVGT